MLILHRLTTQNHAKPKSQTVFPCNSTNPTKWCLNSLSRQEAVIAVCFTFTFVEASWSSEWYPETMTSRLTSDASAATREMCKEVWMTHTHTDVYDYPCKALQDEYWNLKEPYRADISPDASWFFPPMNGTIRCSLIIKLEHCCTIQACIRVDSIGSQHNNNKLVESVLE